MDKIKKYIKNQKNNTLTVLGILMMIFVLMMYVGGLDKKSKNIETENTEIENISEDNFESKLENILSQISGAGEVKVMITYQYSKELVPAYDISDDYTSDGTTEKRKSESKVVMSDKNTALIIKERYPQVEGVVIVAQGGGNEEVRKSLEQAAQALLNVDVHKIEVLKMK
jgi:stage III sporulation protein AG